ncbi:hypothetical protein SUGI_1042260 [Cryptomeria japonica]|nr:hypothetical protein SUGI_1042260 [Cryptomeria japonica]
MDVVWSHIMDEAVQHPCGGKFSYEDLSWKKYVLKGSELFSAWIEANRLKDFIEGESSRNSYPTCLHKSHARKIPFCSNTKSRINSCLEYYMYWCTYGPKDYRKKDAKPFDASSIPKLGKDAVHKKHKQMVHEKMTIFEGQSSRDDFLTMDDIANIDCKIKTLRYMFHSIDAISVQQWVLANIEKWFAYQEYSATDDGDGEVPFVLGIQLPEQIEWMLQYGHNNILDMDSTFGTNAMKFQLYTMLVFDSKHMGVPVAWVIMSRSCAHDIAYWMHILLQRVHMKNIEWSLNAFMVDDAGVEIKVIREVFQCDVYLCSWHVRRAWLKNLIAKVKEIAVRREMFDRLGFIMHHSMDADSTRNAIHICIEDFKDTQPSFIEYFKGRWSNRLSMWARCFHTLKHAGQETNGAIESYHSHLKRRFLKTIERATSRRVDWLVHQLTTHVYIYYWWVQVNKKHGFYRNFDIEKIENTSWVRALKILDDHVTFNDIDDRTTWVTSESNLNFRYEVYTSSLDLSMCSCNFSMQGYMCKHVMKVNLMRERQRQHLSNNLHVDLDSLANTLDSIEGQCHTNVSKHLVINEFGRIIDNENCQLLEDNSMHTQTIDNRDEHAMTEMKLQIAHKFHNLQGILTHTTDLAALTFIDKHLEDLLNKVKSRHISSQLGLDHPSAHPFHPVQDGFGHTVHRQRDMIECMNMRRRPSISNRTPMFPTMPRNRKRQNWFNDLDREDE